MTDVMHDDQREDPPLTGDEAATLRGFLDYHRDTLRWKTRGLTAAQLAATLAPSTMTLGGMLKHLAYVEGYWLGEVFRGGGASPPFDTAPWADDPDWEWHSAAADAPDALRAMFDAATAASDRVIDEALAAGGLGAQAARERRGQQVSLRWILVHLIEEYARHNGHADLLRESIDGSVGE
jgi:uncharacterized damage-inducible protein DinB